MNTTYSNNCHNVISMKFQSAFTLQIAHHPLKRGERFGPGVAMPTASIAQRHLTTDAPTLSYSHTHTLFYMVNVDSRIEGMLVI